MCAARVLVISDIHLGEDLYVDDNPALDAYVHALNRELADFIAFHRAGTPAHLVINGDMFDFVKLARVSLPKRRKKKRRRKPVPMDADASAVAPMEAESSEIVLRLRRIVEVHAPLFRELALFVLAGHRVTIIEGNHDAECYLREVRTALRESVLALAHKVQDERGEPRCDASLFAERWKFRTWFEAEALDGVSFHIEHGHQYDEFCSFEYNLAPYNDATRRSVAMPLTHRAIPYFTELLRAFASHPIESFDGRSTLKFMREIGPRKAWVLFKVYCMAMVELSRRAGKRARGLYSAMADEHTSELRALVGASPYSLETLTRMDAMKAPPAELSVIKMMRVFWFDLVIATGFAIAGVLLSLIVVGTLVGGTAGLLSALTVLVGCVYVVRRGHKDRRLDVVGVLRRAGGRLAQVTGARFVVFGHSHRAELVRFGGDAFYLNSGSWVTREVLRGEQGSGMTFVEIDAEGAALKRWAGRDKTARVLATSHDAIDVSVPAHEPRKRGQAVRVLKLRLAERRAKKQVERAAKREARKAKRDARRNIHAG